MPADVRRALLAYRVMSIVVGVMLLFLVSVAIPLQYAGNRPTLARVGFDIHGGLYIVYLLTAANLARRARFSLGQLIGVVCAGFLPFLAFYVESRTTRRVMAAYASAG